MTDGGRAAPDIPGGSAGKMSAGAIASIVGVVVLLLFMFQNRQSVRFTLLFWSLEWPLWLVILTSAVVGAVIWVGLGVMRRHRRRKARRG